MNIHKLHIFSKNRDAVAAQKGYSYQQLKTLEDWIEIRIVGGNEEIYCEFEDDIFTKDTAKQKTSFKQIKLYSSDFSFSSESIKTAISHFFSLYTKVEYSLDQVEFHFETNVSVVSRTVRDNDAALLEEWHINQENISTQLLQRIRVRIKNILAEYVKKRAEELTTNAEFTSELQIAINIYNNLMDEDFDRFIQCIKWRFDGDESNKAIETILARIQELIPQIPLPLIDNKTNVYSSLLVNEVFQRSIKDEPEDRKLTKELLDAVLLNAGEIEDQWYAEVFQLCKGFTPKYFYPGEFQTAISGTRYCRSQKLDDSHTYLWLTLLKEYINLAETPVTYKRKAIYEYFFLKIEHNLLYQSSVSLLVDEEDFINYYFDNWQQSTRVQSIEDDIVLLQLIKGQLKGVGISFLEEQVYKWENDIKTYLESEIEKEKRVDRLCELLEMRGHLAHQSAIFDSTISYKTAFEYYKKIPPLLEKAQFYSLARLYAQMQQMVRALIVYGFNDELLELTDQFMSEIQEYADQTGLRHKAAHGFIEMGALHVERHDLPNYLKALELFHKAKERWRLDHTKEGYILSLLGIAGVYEGLGMTYASKYYALIALWSTWHSADPTLYKHLPKAFSQIVHLDYKHGAWINAINDFNLYLSSKREFDENGLEMDDDEIYHKAVIEIASLIYATPLLHPPMREFVDALKQELGFTWTQQIHALVEGFSGKVADVDALKHILQQKLIDQPLNDVGLHRNIRFMALRNEWHIQFENSNELTPIGEEFVSFLQIMLCELARINPAVLHTEKQIFVILKRGYFQKQYATPNQWIVTIPEFDSKEQLEIQMHYTYIGALIKAILQEVSPLSKDEFTQLYIDELLKQRRLGEKALEAAAYQRVLRNTVTLSGELNEQKIDLPSLNNAISFLPRMNWLM